MMDEDVCILFRVNQSLNTFWRKGCPEREVHCLNTQVLCRYLISIENSRFCVMVLLVGCCSHGLQRSNLVGSHSQLWVLSGFWTLHYLTSSSVLWHGPLPNTPPVPQCHNKSLPIVCPYFYCLKTLVLSHLTPDALLYYLLSWKPWVDYNNSSESVLTALLVCIWSYHIFSKAV